MNITVKTLQRLEFEARIFVSLGIVALTCALSFLVVVDSRSTLILLARFASADESTFLTYAYAVGAVVMLAASTLRMWAGSVLTPTRVMAFRVQTDALKTTGPYRMTRNPIYLADFTALCMFALFLPPIGLLMPVLFAVHYHRLIAFEEESFTAQRADAFHDYLSRTPRMLPSPESLSRIARAMKEFRISREGFRHNALFVLFIPGFALAAVTHELSHALIVGLPAVIDWAIIHTRIGMPK